jgi:hypothetical protein
LTLGQAKRLKELERRERQAETAGGGAVVGEAASEGYYGDELLSPERRRTAVEHACQQHGMSERHECRLVGEWRATHRHRPTHRGEGDALTEVSIQLASEDGR